MFASKLYGPGLVDVDDENRIRMDDEEMRGEIQSVVDEAWPRITTENLKELTDFEGYRKEFLRLFGFGLSGVDYDADVDPVVE